MSRDSVEKPENRSTASPTHIVILGNGFAGIEVLKKLQKKFDLILMTVLNYRQKRRLSLHSQRRLCSHTFPDRSRC